MLGKETVWTWVCKRSLMSFLPVTEIQLTERVQTTRTISGVSQKYPPQEHMKSQQALLSQSMPEAIPCNGAFCKWPVIPETDTVTLAVLVIALVCAIPELFKAMSNPCGCIRRDPMKNDWREWTLGNKCAPVLHRETHCCLGKESSPFKSCFVKNCSFWTFNYLIV